MPRAFWIAKTRHGNSADEMLSGIGGIYAGARWHSRGRRMVYTANSLSLAILEIAVHLAGSALIPSYNALEIEIPDDIIERPSLADLPAGWDDRSTPRLEVQQWGDRWYDRQRSCVLCVPSAVVKEELNYLLNPEHREFKRIRKIRGPFPCDFDRRIKQ